GFPDIVLSVNGNLTLLHNEKNGTFKDVTKSAGITGSENNTGLAFVDYDHDGDLDLYVAQSMNSRIVDTERPADPGSPSPAPDAVISDSGLPGNVMWRNNGNKTFSNVTDATGLSSPAASTAAVGSDYNNDRAVDIIATGWHGSAAIFTNKREG